MERNIGDQLNKAFEAYRQASIEKDNAKKDLQQMTEHYERYTQKLQKQIEDQQQLISKLKAQLMSSAKQASEENKLEPSPRKEEEETLLPCNHLLDSTGPSRRMQHRQENMDTGVFVAHTVPVNSSIDNKDMLEVFEAIQGKFQQIRSLTRRQKDHLKRFNGGNDTPNDQRFSMPIQCTDGTVEQAERPFPSALRSAVDIPHPPASLASRGTSPEDRDLVDSLTSLSVKFPPPADSEYEFLNSAPERHVGLAMPRKRTVGSVPASATAAAVVEEEVPVDVAMAFVYPTPPSHSVSSSTASLSQECVRGPQQPLWSPELCDAAVAPVDVETEPETSQGSSPDKCAFCHAVVPQDLMNSHLYSHFSPKGEESD